MLSQVGSDLETPDTLNELNSYWGLAFAVWGLGFRVGMCYIRTIQEMYSLFPTNHQ